MGDKADTRILLIDARFDEDYIRGHIGRVGLAGPQTPSEVIDRLIPTVRADLEHEAERLRDAGFAQFHAIAPWNSVEENAVQLARFLDVLPQTAEQIAGTDFLFSD